MPTGDRLPMVSNTAIPAINRPPDSPSENPSNTPKRHLMMSRNAIRPFPKRDGIDPDSEDESDARDLSSTLRHLNSGDMVSVYVEPNNIAGAGVIFTASGVPVSGARGFSDLMGIVTVRRRDAG